MTCVDLAIGHSGTKQYLLTREAIDFLSALHRCFSPRRQELLAERDRRQHRFDSGRTPSLPSQVKSEREPGWTVTPSRSNYGFGGVVLTGPPEHAFFARGLNSGAGVLIADFDDCLSPTWSNCLESHAALSEALGRTNGPGMKDLGHAATEIYVQPRSWSLDEKHFLVDGIPISASLFDFGLSIFHSARTRSERPAAFRFALSKLESPQEASLWNDVFCFAERRLHIAPGCIQVIVTIDTLSAASEMEGILFQLREYAIALESSPINYLSSFVRTFRARGERLLPQLSDIGIHQPFLRAYQELLVHTCHKREAFAITTYLQQARPGDPSKPSEVDEARISLAMKEELDPGFDSICVAEARLIPIALSACEQTRKRRAPNQPPLGHCNITFHDLTSPPMGRITLTALKNNVESALLYLEGWLSGSGSGVLASGISNMSSTELSRAQLWQWLRHSARLTCGHRVTKYVIECVIRDSLAATESRLGGVEFSASKFSTAADLLIRSCTDGYDSPLVQRAYSHLH